MGPQVRGSDSDQGDVSNGAVAFSDQGDVSDGAVAFSDQGDVSDGAVAFALRRARCLYHHTGHTRGPNITHPKIQAHELPILI